MDFRKAEINDISQLVEMRLGYLEENHGSLTQEEITKIRDSLPSYYENHLGRDMMIYVADDGAEIVSTVFLLVVEKPANPSFITGKTGTVLNVYTKPQYRQKGLAGKLMNMMLDDAKENKLSFVELKATKMGKPLYEKLGFNIEKSSYTPMKYELS